MRFTRRSSRRDEVAVTSRYAIVAAGGEDPEAARPPSGTVQSPTSEPPTAEPPTAGSATAEPPTGGSTTGGRDAPGGAASADPAAEDPVDGELEGDAFHGVEALAPEELERRRSGLEELVAMMRPAIQMDGGDLEVVDVDYAAGVVEVELQGACGSCAISSTTLQGGVERLMKERLDWVTEVHGGVDDSVDPFESAAMGRGAYVPRYY